MTEATKNRILSLVERYGSARAQEELAGSRDANAAMNRHYDAGKKVWEMLNAELDKLTDRPDVIDGQTNEMDRPMSDARRSLEPSSEIRSLRYAESNHAVTTACPRCRAPHGMSPGMLCSWCAWKWGRNPAAPGV